MLTKHLFCLIVTVMLCVMPTLTDGYLAAQDSLTVFSDTTSVLDSEPDTSQTTTADLDDWTDDDDLPDWSQSLIPIPNTMQSILSFFTGMLGLTGALTMFILLVIVLFPLIAIIAIIVLIYKLNREKDKNQAQGWRPAAPTGSRPSSRLRLKDQAINRFMWAVALLLLYWLLGWTILGIIGIILLCIAGSQFWRFKSGQNDTRRQDETPNHTQDE